MSATVRAVILASGGLDSTTLCYDLLRQQIVPTPVFINYGQHCANTELDTLKQVLPHELLPLLEIVDVSDIYRGSDSKLIREADLWNEDVDYQDLYLPYRSLLLLTVGSAFAQSRGFQAVYAAFINSNHAQEIDCSIEFFEKLEPVLSTYGSIELRLPYKDLSKSQVVALGVELKVPLGTTFSCQAGSEIPCGACPNCVDRLDSLAAVSQSI